MYPTTGYWPSPVKVCPRCSARHFSCLYVLCDKCRRDDELHNGPLDQEIFGFNSDLEGVLEDMRQAEKDRQAEISFARYGH